MNRFVEPDLEDLGAQLGRALRSRVAAQQFTPPRLEPVQAGARRRRAVHRSGVVLVCLALIAAGAFALTRRVDQPVPGDDGGGGQRSPMLPAYATLDGAPGVGQPVSMWAQRGGEPMGVAVPQIDVWRSGDQRLVIRTVDNSAALPTTAVTTSVVATVATESGSGPPWAGQAVSTLRVRGVDGAIEELAPDQFAVWIPSASADRYTLVIGRGLTRDAVLSDVESLVDVDGILRPSEGFSLEESAAPLPPTTPSPAFASITYAFTNAPIVSTNSAPGGRSSIETVSWQEVGRLGQADGHEVMFVDGRFAPPSVTWIAEGGLQASVSAAAGNVGDLVRFVHMVSENDVVGQAADLSARLAQSTTEVDHAAVGSAVLTRRQNSDSRVLCIEQVEGNSACVARPAIEESPESAIAQTLINGHWVIFGYRQIVPDDVWPAGFTADHLKFTSTDGSCCTVAMTKAKDAYWYVVDIDDGVDLVDTNVGLVFGGLVGSISRPIVASPL